MNRNGPSGATGMLHFECYRNCINKNVRSLRHISSRPPYSQRKVRHRKGAQATAYKKLSVAANVLR